MTYSKFPIIPYPMLYWPKLCFFCLNDKRVTVLVNLMTACLDITSAGCAWIRLRKETYFKITKWKHSAWHPVFLKLLCEMSNIVDPDQKEQSHLGLHCLHMPFYWKLWCTKCLDINCTSCIYLLTGNTVFRIFRYHSNSLTEGQETKADKEEQT